MNFTFNMGQMVNTSYIENICKNHPECESCPVLEQGAIQNMADKIIYSCSTAIIKNIQKAKNNGNV